MIIDSSVLIAIVMGEPEAGLYLNRINEEAAAYISAATLVETLIAAQHKGGEKHGDAAVADIETILHRGAVEVLPFNEEQARLARQAWKRYGKGHHQAKLNFGDCLSYAAAKYYGEPLLFKGEGFPFTDIAAA